MTATASHVTTFLTAIRDRAAKAGVFGAVTLHESPAMLECAAENSAEPAFYRIAFEEDAWNVVLVTEDRWLSESIESDLMHYGDPIEELISEELDELDWSHGDLAVKHYRSEDMLYTFRSPLPLSGDLNDTDVEIATLALLGYEAAFRELGDMDVDEEDE